MLEPNRPSGMTLIEILTVLAIIGVLAALLFPVFTAARLKAGDATCLSNQKQISHALAMYVADYDGAYPQSTDAVVVNHVASGLGSTWRERLLTYLSGKRFLPCPFTQPLPGDWAENHAGDYSGYALNLRLNIGVRRRTPVASGTGQYTLGGAAETRLRFPALTIVVGEVRAGIISSAQPDMARTEAELQQYAFYSLQLAPLICAQPVGAQRHHSGANYAFADGHVKWCLPTWLSTNKENDGETPGFGL